MNLDHDSEENEFVDLWAHKKLMDRKDNPSANVDSSTFYNEWIEKGVYSNSSPLVILTYLPTS
jgi:hypothetical protein